MPEFLAQHGYQSQPRGYVIEDPETREYWINEGSYVIFPTEVVNNKNDYGLGNWQSHEPPKWRSYYTNDYTYYRLGEFALNPWLNSPGIRVLYIDERPGFTIEQVCKMYYKYKGVRNDVANPTQATFPRKSFDERCRQLQTANYCVNPVNNNITFSIDTRGASSSSVEDSLNYGDTLIYGKHSGWAWNKGNTDETKMWIPNFTSEGDTAYNAQNNYRWAYGEDASDGPFGYDHYSHYQVARAIYSGYVWEYAYQSDITEGNGVTYLDYTEFGGPDYPDTNLKLTTDHSQSQMLYTHDISLKPYQYGPELTDNSSQVTDAFFVQGGSTKPDGDHYNYSTSIHPWAPLGAFTQYPGRGFGSITADYYSNESDYLNRKFGAHQQTYYARNLDGSSVPYLRLDSANYIKIPVTYWTEVHQGITFYHRRVGGSGIENKINLELLFHS